jgi:hypothetical protein
MFWHSVLRKDRRTSTTANHANVICIIIYGVYLLIWLTDTGNCDLRGLLVQSHGVCILGKVGRLP